MTNFKQQNGFALVTGLLMLLVLTLLATVVMRGTTLELAMTTAVTKQEQALILADSARSLSRELLISAVEYDPSQPGRDRSEAVAGRKANVPLFAITPPAVACTAEQGGALGGVLGGAGNNYAQGSLPYVTHAGIDSLAVEDMERRMQTINAVPAHIPSRNNAQVDCTSGTLSFAVVDLSKRLPEGIDAERPEIIKTVGLVGIGRGFGGGTAKVVSISDILVNPN